MQNVVGLAERTTDATARMGSSTALATMNTPTEAAMTGPMYLHSARLVRIAVNQRHKRHVSLRWHAALPFQLI